MREIPVDFVGSSTFERYPKQSVATTYNMIISDTDLVPYWGYKKALTIESGGLGKRLYRANSQNKMVFVVNNDVYLVTPALTYQYIGSMAFSSSPIFISENNGSELCIVNGNNVYAYEFKDPDKGLYLIPKSAFPIDDLSPNYVSFYDTYFMIADSNSNQWILSDNNDVTTWPALNVGALESRNDTVQAVLPLGRQVFVMGKVVTEIWRDVGAPAFPFQRDNNIEIPYGVLNVETIACNFGKLVWLGSSQDASASILISEGGYPEILSSDGLTNLINNLIDPSDAHAFLNQENGHITYQITFRTDNITLIYDFTTKKLFNVTDHNLDRHIAYNAVFIDGKNYFCSDLNSKIYQYNSNLFTADGQSIPRIRRTSNLRQPTQEVFKIDELSMTIEQGQSYTPMSIDLRMSKNGGELFGNYYRKTLNPLGQRRNILRWFNLGSANDVVFEARFNFGNANNNNQFNNGISGVERTIIMNGLMKVSQ